MVIPKFIEIPALLENKITQRITFDTEGIKIEKLLSFDPHVLIPSENISAFRYGVIWIRGYAFNIGRHYFIEIRDFQNNIFKIKLKSYYGIRRQTYYEIWCEIFNNLWETYFCNTLNY